MVCRPVVLVVSKVLVIVFVVSEGSRRYGRELNVTGELVWLRSRFGMVKEWLGVGVVLPLLWRHVCMCICMFRDVA